MTGVWPATHGVYANQKFDPLGSLHGEAITEASTVKVKTLWQAAHDAGYTTASVGFPVTTGAAGIDWLMPANAAFEGRSEEGSAAPADPNRHYDHPAGLRETLAPDLAGMKDVDIEHTRFAWTLAILRRYKPELMTTHIGDLDHAEHATGPFSAESFATMEFLDQQVATLMEVERTIDPDAIIAIVSDHGFEPVEKTFNINVLFSEAGLMGKDVWKAAPWITGGTAAVVLKDPKDADVLKQVRVLLDKAAATPEYGIAAVLSHDELVRRGGSPEASFLVEMKPGYKFGTARQGKVLVEGKRTGTHGYLPERPELRASFLMVGKGIAHGRDLGVIDMRVIAPTLAAVLGVKLEAAEKPAMRVR